MAGLSVYTADVDEGVAVVKATVAEVTSAAYQRVTSRGYRIDRL